MTLSTPPESGKREDADTRASIAAPTLSHWQELPPRYGPDAWELRVWDDHWYRVFGKRVVLCPIGLGQGVYASTDEAKRAAEGLYRKGLQRAVERAHRMTLQANAGLAMLDG